jgi:glycosyltransferase involved in cell wall biosynthesis
MSRIAFSWNGLPFYAACLIARAIDLLGEDCTVIGSPPSVPTKGMEEVLRSKIHWIPYDKPASWHQLGLETPQLFFQSGWGYPAFSQLGREVTQAGGAVIGMSDANWRGDFRQAVLGRLKFHLKLVQKFDAMLVPGEQGARLMRAYGFRDDQIYRGMYGSDPAVFGGGAPLSERPREILFVGQFVDRKNVMALSRAFIKFSETRPEWRLRLCGSGELRDHIPRHPQIIVQDFLQAHALAELYRGARFFVLPSKVEAWGLVVHEAGLTGCALLLSDAIGSGDDLASPANSLRFAADDENAILLALHDAADMDDNALVAAERESRKLAQAFGPDRFAREIGVIARRFLAS